MAKLKQDIDRLSADLAAVGTTDELKGEQAEHEYFYCLNLMIKT